MHVVGQKLIRFNDKMMEWLMYNNIRKFIITGVNSLVIILYQNIKYSEYERNYRALLQEHFYF